MALPTWLGLFLALSQCIPGVWVLADTVTYDFNITWVNTNPDGLFNRPTIGINGEWPIPTIEVTKGDNLVINVQNQLGNQSTSLHFHGLFMNASSHMDGPSQVSQCPILPGTSFTYNFTVDQPGTYWYHSHTQSQYPDGLRGPLVVHDPDSPYADQYDEELVLTLSDWYHDQMPKLISEFMNKGNPTGAEPVPQSALMNETQDFPIPVEPNTTYLFRVINMGAFASQYVWIEGHSMTVIEVDGVYTEKYETDMIYLAAAQRCSFLVTTKGSADTNYAIVGSMDTTLFDVMPDDLNWNVTGHLVYSSSAPLPTPALIDDDEFQPMDDMLLVPYDREPLLPAPDRIIQLDVEMDNLRDGANYAFFNNITYVAPQVPTLYTALSASSETAMDSQVYGDYTHSFVLDKGEVVQIVLNNLDDGRHPFHLHGHHFQAVYRGEEDSGTFEEDGAGEGDFPEYPMRRDTLVVWPNGNMVLRFRADNPGVWLFHCHIEWHVTSGLVATMVEAPLELQKTLQIPQDHLDACHAGGIPVSGNAAGNDEDWLDLTGQNKPPGPLPEGFEPRGYVAIVFSGIAGVLGVFVVAWYGLNPVDGAMKLGEGADGQDIADDDDDDDDDAAAAAAAAEDNGRNGGILDGDEPADDDAVVIDPTSLEREGRPPAEGNDIHVDISRSTERSS